MELYVKNMELYVTTMELYMKTMELYMKNTELDVQNMELYKNHGITKVIRVPLRNNSDHIKIMNSLYRLHEDNWFLHDSTRPGIQVPNTLEFPSHFSKVSKKWKIGVETSVCKLLRLPLTYRNQ